MDTNNANGIPVAAEYRNGAVRPDCGGAYPSGKGGGIKEIDSDICDRVSLRLSGLIGIFDLIVEIATKDSSRGNENETMTDFAFYISNELKSLYKTVSGVDYR